VAHAAGPPLHAEPKKQKKRGERLFFDEKRERFHPRRRPIFRFHSSADDVRKKEKERETLFRQKIQKCSRLSFFVLFVL
jgi:hypothetical protein